MENEQQVAKKSNSKLMPIAIVATVVVLVIAIAAFAITKGSEKAKEEELENQAGTQETKTITELSPTQAQVMASYKDGIYKADGMYTSPGGQESITVSLTIKDGIVTASQVTPHATRPISIKMQKAFVDGYKEQVIGKKIDDISISKVASSSLTPKGFQDALDKIKAEAKA